MRGERQTHEKPTIASPNFSETFGLRTAVNPPQSLQGALARMFHESLAAATDMVALSEKQGKSGYRDLRGKFGHSSVDAERSHQMGSDLSGYSQFLPGRQY